MLQPLSVFCQPCADTTTAGHGPWVNPKKPTTLFAPEKSIGPGWNRGLGSLMLPGLDRELGWPFKASQKEALTPIELNEIHKQLPKRLPNLNTP